MLDIVYCEWLKLKHSKIIRMIFLGSLICPILTLSNSFIRNCILSNKAMDLFEIYDSAIVFLMLLFAPVIMSVIAVFLIVREYTEKTWKTIFVVPVSRIQILAGKFIMLFFLIMFFMILSWAEILVFTILCSFLFEISGITWMTALFFLFRMIKGGVLLYPVITPFLYLALRTKGGLVPFIVIAGVVLVNIVLSSTFVAGFYPWLLPHRLLYWSMYKKTGQAGGSIAVGIWIVGLLFVLSAVGGIWQIWTEDID